ncbi:MAG: lysophospholipid acyltransferase family protein [Acidobacteria bacterium]|nr:lysophospholipid acyltransferase family protein [Acidobacteriota bacterium]
MDFLYQTVRGVGRFWIWFFFKSVQVRSIQRIPRQGPVLLCVNHPNDLIDSLLVGAVVPRKVRFLAPAALSRNPVLAWVLSALGVIPVYRRQDDPDKMDRNVEAFEACFRAFARGDLVVIYPEGTTHTEPRVQRIKTGAARIALEAEHRHDGRLGLTVIPVGLNFEARKSFQGRVLICAGEPIPLIPHLEVYRSDPWKAVQDLTTEIQRGMEAQVIHVDRIDLTALIRVVETLYRDDLVQELQVERGLSPDRVDPFRLSRTIADAVQYFVTHDPSRVEHLWYRLQVYETLRAEFRLQDRTVRTRLTAPGPGVRLRDLGLGLFGFPVFLYGAVTSGLPYWIPRWLARHWARKETTYATVRFLASVSLFPLFWGMEAWLVGTLTNPGIAGAFLLSLPLTGLLAHRYLSGWARLGQALRFLRLVRTHRGAVRRILTRRRQILEDLERAKQDYLQVRREHLREVGRPGR